ncbi:expressed unknown protein [Seminavis robusta]|uniref:Uncharacterized protein n=1 Tax=Seminavis robusta TaxID=568900 RepID=A0A9N8E5Q7_9STRA|nr:expressed unknown protein [Seminavis robusta]|eukprot:Sro680_g186280.1 n/a (199) ;mRNA; r:41491-42087
MSSYLPTETHQLTPFASPTAGRKRCLDLDLDLPLLDTGSDSDTTSVLFLPPLPFVERQQNQQRDLSYFPRRVSGSCVETYATTSSISSSSSWGDGDVTPPLSPKPTIKVVSPGATANTFFNNINNNKRMRYTVEDQEQQDEDTTFRNKSVVTNTDTNRPRPPSPLWVISLEKLLLQEQRNSQRKNNTSFPVLPQLPKS